jgi:hypothetical protein
MKVKACPGSTPGAEQLLIEREGDDRIGRRITPILPRDLSGAGIYFVGAAGAGLVKIGWVLRASQVEGRLARLQTDCPYPVVLLHLVTPATQVHERRLHKRFLAHHFHGEWFHWEGEVRAFLERAEREPDAANAELLASLVGRALTMSRD